MHLVTDDLTSPVHLHQTRLHEPIDVRTEAAQAGREPLRKHVNGALGKVDRRAALVGRLIERRPFRDVVRHVGDVDPQPDMAVGQAFDRDRVVEIAGILAVDRDDDAIAKIGPALEIAFLDRRAEAARFLDGFRWVLVRNAVLLQDDLGIDPWLVDPAEHAHDPPQRAARRRRPTRHLDGHHVTRLSVLGVAARNLDVGHQPAIERQHEAKPRIVHIEPTDHGLSPTLENLDDSAFGPTVGAVPLDANDDAIAVQRLGDIGGGNEDVALQAVGRPLRCDEAEAGGMAFETADHEVHAIGKAVAIAPDEDKRAVGNERAQVSLHGDPFVSRNAKELQQLTCGRRMVDLLAQRPEELIA